METTPNGHPQEEQESTTKTHLSSSNVQLPSPLPNLIALLLLIILTLATIALGYIKGNMHLLTTLKNAKL